MIQHAPMLFQRQALDKARQIDRSKLSNFASVENAVPNSSWIVNVVDCHNAVLVGVLVFGVSNWHTPTHLATMIHQTIEKGHELRAIKAWGEIVAGVDVPVVPFPAGSVLGKRAERASQFVAAGDNFSIGNPARLVLEVFIDHGVK